MVGEGLESQSDQHIITDVSSQTYSAACQWSRHAFACETVTLVIIIINFRTEQLNISVSSASVTEWHREENVRPLCGFIYICYKNENNCCCVWLKPCIEILSTVNIKSFVQASGCNQADRFEQIVPQTWQLEVSFDNWFQFSILFQSSLQGLQGK